MAGWLYQPVMFDSPHSMTCDGFTPEQCSYYQQHWHNWYVADWAFALPTVAFFMCTIGIFIIGYAITQLLALFSKSGPPGFRKAVAATRYLSYRGYRIEALKWNSAPVGLLFLALIGTTYFFCMDLIPSPYYWPGSSMVWGNSPPLGTRSGWLALACMPFLFATATKANWITLVTGVPHEKLQVFHRWIAYAFMVLALMHTFPFLVWHIMNHDMVEQFNVTGTFEYWTGIVALLFQAWLTFASWGPFRSLGYEFFKSSHFVSAIVFMVIFFWHCAGTLTSWHYFVATAAIYVPCWTYPWLRTLFEYGVGQKAQVFVEENGFTRITIPANFNWRPGQHCFLRIRGFGLQNTLSSHPFTICSLPSLSAQKPSATTFYIRHRSGFTARLYNRALKQPGVQVPVLVDGPYGGIDNNKFFSSDRLIVIAGGSGAGWMLPFIEQFLRHPSGVTRTSDSPVAEKDTVEEKPGTLKHSPQAESSAIKGIRSLRVILATRDVATRTWFHTTVSQLILACNPSPDTITSHHGIAIEVHLTSEAEHILSPSTSKNPKTDDVERSASPSSSERSRDQKTPMPTSVPKEDEVRGRPDLPSIVRDEANAATRLGNKVGVFVCGPLEMQNDVRNAVARENLEIVKGSRKGGEMYLHLEHFSWA